MKRPYLQLYIADWQSNAKLRLCSHAEKGIWLDVMCILHDQDEYGVVRWPLKQLAQAVHASAVSLRKLIDREILKGADIGSTCGAFIYIPRSGRKVGEPVTLIAEQPGPIWYSSRMVRDEHLRQVRGDNEPKDPDFSVSKKPPPKVGIGEGFGGDKNPPPSHASVRDTHPSSSVSDPDSTSGSGSSALPPKDLFGFEEKDPLPKNGSGETPAKKPGEIDVFKIWNLGVKLLSGSGMSEKEARSFLGKQVQTYGRPSVARAVTETLAQEAIAPQQYIVAVLQKTAGGRQEKCKVERSIDTVRRGIAEREAQRDAISR